MPSAIRNQLKMLKAGSSIHIQATVLNTVGTMNGNSSTARTRFFMRKFWFIATARASPPTIFNSVATPVYTKVLIATRQKIGSLKSLTKFLSPTRSEEHTSELQSRFDLVCRLLLEKK